MRDMHIHDPLSLRVSEFDALLLCAYGARRAEAEEVTDTRSYVEAEMRKR